MARNDVVGAIGKAFEDIEAFQHARHIHYHRERHALADVAPQVGGVAGGLGSYFLQWYAAVRSYPENIGGRPLHSWPMFIPVTFELTILGAASAAVFGMLALNGLPMPYHPVFNAERFALASRDRFFLCIEARDPKFEHDEVWAFLTGLGPTAVMDVED